MNGELLHRVDAALGLRLRGIPAIRGVLAFDAHGLGVGGKTVYPDSDVGTISRPREKLHNRVGIADSGRACGGTDGHDGEVVHRVGSDRVAKLTAFGFQQRSGLCDRHRLRVRSYFQHNVDTVGLSDVDRDALADEFLETWNGDCELILSGGQLRQCVVSGGGRSGLINSAGFDVFDFHGRGGHHGAGGIRNRAGDSSTVALRKNGAREREAAGCNCKLFHRNSPQS